MQFISEDFTVYTHSKCCFIHVPHRIQQFREYLSISWIALKAIWYTWNNSYLCGNLQDSFTFMHVLPLKEDLRRKYK